MFNGCGYFAAAVVVDAAVAAVAVVVVVVNSFCSGRNKRCCKSMFIEFPLISRSRYVLRIAV